MFNGLRFEQQFLACQVGARMLRSGLLVMESEVSERSCKTLKAYAMQNWSSELNFSGHTSKFGVKSFPFLRRRLQLRRHDWRIPFALNTGGLSGNGGQENLDGDSGLGGTRLGRITGDWDVLVAGVVVAAIEGIGMLMYRKPSSLSTGRLQSFVVMMNYWKAGVCLGLFVDAFKLGR
ncbi:hypothetical protein GH714_016746 [Hevea brasiliensis]|uniref:Uncharacterized protein n=1 Tax=Hevea brasiliensis TaxID=3981 RepID=A0A6A6KE81_HEVBR|nr:hypothetical protein GH714_016746 [Hevea brasiliensis]